VPPLNQKFGSVLLSMTVTNYSLNSAQPATAIIPSTFSKQTVLHLLFRRQWPPPAPNTFQPKRGPLVAHWYKEATPLNQQFGSVVLKHSKGDQYYLWMIVTYCNIMPVRTRQGINGIKMIEELQLNNKKKNDEIRKQQEEKKKQKKDEEETRRIQEEAEKEKEEAITPQSLHDVLSGVDSTQTKMRAVDNAGEERSPLKN
jgi:hypothetical protein